jgi:hypothetical protein
MSKWSATPTKLVAGWLPPPYEGWRDLLSFSTKSKLTLIWHNAQATFAGAMNVSALFLTNS